MRRFWAGYLVLLVAMALGGGAILGQGSNPAPGASTPNPPASTSAATKNTAARRPKVNAGVTPRVIPLESAPPSPPTPPADEAAQKAKDQRLLEDQKRQSVQAAQITNQQVDKAQRQQDSAQKEVRIQDAPGPVQTGVVPAVGAPVVPTNADQRIQDAPGPAQTLPQPVPAQPQPQPQPSVPPEL